MFTAPPCGVVASITRGVTASREACYQAIQGSHLEQLTQRIKALIHENRHLMFWFSASAMLTAAPSIFLGTAVIGLVAAMNNHFGLRERKILYLSCETLHGLVSGIVFICALLFHYHVQCVWGGISAGSYVYRLWNGQVHKSGVKGLRAIEIEMHLLNKEFGSWVRALIPDAKPSRHNYRLMIPKLTLA